MSHPSQRDPLPKRADVILNTAHNFCTAFAVGESPSSTLDKYFTRTPSILEHGPLPSSTSKSTSTSLPFLGQTFTGRRSSSQLTTRGKTCDDYYTLLTSILSFHPSPSTVPPKDQFLVDPQRQAVTVKLHGKFASVKTGKSWEEDFVYILSEFDEEGRIGRQEIWADPLSAWMAVQE